MEIFWFYSSETRRSAEHFTCRKFFSSVHGFTTTAFSNSTLPAQAVTRKTIRAAWR